jgi:hypothetical protein
VQELSYNFQDLMKCKNIFRGGSAQPLKIRAGSIMLEKGRALGPSLFSVPITQATALVPRHLKTRKGL